MEKGRLSRMAHSPGSGRGCRKAAQDALDWDATNVAPLAYTVSFWVASRYAVKIRRVVEAKGSESWGLPREMCADIAELRRSDHTAQRLILERERVVPHMLDAERKWSHKILVALEV